MFTSPTAATDAIKKWKHSNGNVTILVSSASMYPAGVALDCAGNVYIGDYIQERGG